MFAWKIATMSPSHAWIAQHSLLFVVAIRCPCILLIMQEGKEAPKADAKSTKDKAAAGKKEDKSKDKKDAAAAKQATVMQLQRETSPKQPQQQKRTKDTDRVKDAALRGTAGDDKAAQELAAHKELVAKAQEKADEVRRVWIVSACGMLAP